MKSVRQQPESSGQSVGPFEMPESICDWIGIQDLLGLVLTTCMPGARDKIGPTNNRISELNSVGRLVSDSNSGGPSSKALIPSILVYSYSTGQYSSIDIATNRNEDEGLKLLLAPSSVRDIDLRNFRRGFRDDLTRKLYEVLLMVSANHLSGPRSINFQESSQITDDLKKVLSRIAVNRVQKGILIDHMFLDE